MQKDISTNNVRLIERGIWWL